jgi:hypothetical protein
MQNNDGHYFRLKTCSKCWHLFGTLTLGGTFAVSAGECDLERCQNCAKPIRRFTPHPVYVYSGNVPTKIIIPLALEHRQLLRGCGIEGAAVGNTSQAVARETDHASGSVMITSPYPLQQLAMTPRARCSLEHTIELAYVVPVRQE